MKGMVAIAVACVLAGCSPPGAADTTIGEAAVTTTTEVRAWEWVRVDGDASTIPFGSIFPGGAGFLLTDEDTGWWESSDGLGWVPVAEPPLDGDLVWLGAVGPELWAYVGVPHEAAAVWRYADDEWMPVAFEPERHPWSWIEPPAFSGGTVVVPASGKPGEPGVWSGALGEVMTRVEGPWAGWHTLALVSDEGFVVLSWGREGEPAGAAHSTDGVTWVEADPPFGEERVDWLTVGGGDGQPFLASVVEGGNEFDIQTTWRSDDGLRWRRSAESPQSADPGTESFLSGTFGLASVAFGESTDEGDPVVVKVSADGERWEDVSLPEIAYPLDPEAAGQLGWWAADDRLFVIREVGDARTLWVGGFGVSE